METTLAQKNKTIATVYNISVLIDNIQEENLFYRILSVISRFSKLQLRLIKIVALKKHLSVNDFISIRNVFI